MKIKLLRETFRKSYEKEKGKDISSRCCRSEKLRIRRATAGTRCGETKRRDAACQRDGAGFTGSTLCLPHETPPQHLVAKPDVSCWELARFTSDKSPALLAFSFNRGVKRPRSRCSLLATFRNRLEQDHFAEMYRTMRAAALYRARLPPCKSFARRN